MAKRARRLSRPAERIAALAFATLLVGYIGVRAVWVERITLGRGAYTVEGMPAVALGALDMLLAALLLIALIQELGRLAAGRARSADDD
jgi:hypothetical protein